MARLEMAPDCGGRPTNVFSSSAICDSTDTCDWAGTICFLFHHLIVWFFAQDKPIFLPSLAKRTKQTGSQLQQAPLPKTILSPLGGRSTALYEIKTMQNFERNLLN